MTDNFWIAFFAFLSIVSPAAIAWLNQYFAKKAEKRKQLADEETAAKVDDLSHVVKDTQKKAQGILTAVNGSMKYQLKAYAILAHTHADSTGKPEDMERANEADTALEDHIRTEERRLRER